VDDGVTIVESGFDRSRHGDVAYCDLVGLET